MGKPPAIMQLPEKVFLIDKVFYWNCRLNGRTALLAGPFASAELAEQAADFVGPVCIQYRPETRKATFGVVRMNAPGLGMGIYNEILPEKLLGEILLDTGYREGDRTN